MKQCKYCQAEMEEEATLCPSCGKDNSQEPEAPVTAEAETTQEKSEAVSEGMKAAFEDAEKAPAKTEAGEGAVSGGKAVPSTPIQEGAKATPGKIALAVAAVVVLLAALIALIVMGARDSAPSVSATPTENTTSTETTTQTATVPADGNSDDVTCKGTYTVSDEEARAARDTVVARLGGAELTNGQLQVYYWMEVQSFLSNYGAYAAYFGLDYTQPLDVQPSMEEGYNSWQQFFLNSALTYWHQIQAMALEAEKAGLELTAEDQEYLANLETSLTETASGYDMTLDELMLSNIGPGADLREFAQYQEIYLRGMGYYSQETAKFEPTEAELEAFFAEHEAEYAENSITKDGVLVDVRHILVGPEGGTADENGVTTYSEEEWAACEAEAQEILDQWLAGDKTEESFAALANSKSEDGGSNTNGGLYEDVYTGQMVEPFDAWCFDEARQSGDYGLVKTDYGYHVMYFVDSRPQWKVYAQSDWTNEQINAMIDGLTQAYPMEVDYEKIALGLVNLGG